MKGEADLKKPIQLNLGLNIRILSDYIAERTSARMYNAAGVKLNRSCATFATN
jgi:hypothetical protein